MAMRACHEAPLEACLFLHALEAMPCTKSFPSTLQTLDRRDALMAMRGYPEVPLPGHLDDIVTLQAVRLGLHYVS